MMDYTTAGHTPVLHAQLSQDLPQVVFRQEVVECHAQAAPYLLGVALWGSEALRVVDSHTHTGPTATSALLF